jgi:hypothetical protein
VIPFSSTTFAVRVVVALDRQRVALVETHVIERVRCMMPRQSATGTSRTKSKSSCV